MEAVALPLPQVPPAEGKKRALFLHTTPHRGCLILPHGRPLESTWEAAEPLLEALGIELTPVPLSSPWSLFLNLRLCEALTPALFGQPLPLALPDSALPRTLALLLDGGDPGLILKRVWAVPDEELGFAVAPDSEHAYVFPVQLAGGSAAPYPTLVPEMAEGVRLRVGQGWDWIPGKGLVRSTDLEPATPLASEIAQPLAELLADCRDPALPRAIARWLEGSPVACRLADGSELHASIRGPLYRYASVQPLTGFRREVTPCARAFAGSF